MLIAWSPAGSKSTSWRRKSSERYNNILKTEVYIPQLLRNIYLCLKIYRATTFRKTSMHKDVSYTRFRVAALLIGNFLKNWIKKSKRNSLTTFSEDSVTTRKFESKWCLRREKVPELFLWVTEMMREANIRGGKTVKPKNSRQRELLFGTAGKFG